MSASPYKSRLFNLLNRQSIKVKVRLGRGLRQLQNTVDLGLQILLYPIYFIVQSARQAQKTLTRSLHYKQLPFAAPPEAEILYPLERVLEIVQDTPSLASAIATDLQGRQLVFVSPEQEILDIIEPPQQRQLEREIKTAIANYYYDLRLKAKFTRQAPGLMPQKQTKVLAPIRWFWQLMSWEQQGEVALSIDIFGESSLPVPAPLPPTPPIIVALDETLARFDTTAPPPETTYKVYIWRLYWLIYGAIDHYFGTPAGYESLEATGAHKDGVATLPGVRENLPARIKFFSGYLQTRIRVWLGEQESDDVLDRIKEDPFTIAALIKAAVDHYFASPTTPLIAPAAATAVPEDPWLSWTDLYAGEESVVESRKSQSTNPERDRIEGKIEEILKKLPQGKPRKKKGSGKSIGRAIANLNKPKAIEKKPVTPSDLVISTPSTSSIVRGEEEENSLTPFEKPYIDPLFDAYEPHEWVETKSVSGGYVKHPLERILEGLDTIILWAENLILNVWRGIKSLLRKNKRRKN
ncbi:MAG: hypothetical protein N5P05_003135 [Chroococcopsis gigantea SAG 12.99]|nr:hypothetical protein [Chroococcopsis gigantea SAG 12.99]